MTQLTHLSVWHCVVGENPWIMTEDVGVGVDRKRRDWEELGCATHHVWWRPDLVMKEPPSTPWLPSRLTRLNLGDLKFAPERIQMTERVRARLNEDSELRRARRAREDEDDRKEREGEVEEMRRRQREVVAAYAQLREKKKKGKGKAGEEEKPPTNMPTVRGGEKWDDVPDEVATDADGKPEKWPLDFVSGFLDVAIVCNVDAAPVLAASVREARALFPHDAAQAAVPPHQGSPALGSHVRHDDRGPAAYVVVFSVVSMLICCSHRLSGRALDQAVPG
jgi:hypothetical protein